MSRARWTVVAAVAAGGLGKLVRQRRAPRPPSPRVPDSPTPPPLSTQSSPGQIADLQQAYGADMVPESAPAAEAGPATG